MSTIKTNKLVHTANGASEFTLPQTDGSADQVIKTDGSGNLSFVAQPTGGLAMADQWRITSHYTFSGAGGQVLEANWERNDSTGFGNIGSAMTQSSGVFNFPSTGVYLIMGYAQFYAAGGSQTGFMQALQTKHGSGASFESKAISFDSGYTTNAYGMTSTQFIMNVTDTTHDQVRMLVEGNANHKVMASSTSQRTGFTFLKLG